jgi:hypothetical protein
VSGASSTWLTMCAGLENPAAGRAGAVVVNVENGSSLAVCLSSELEPDREGL